MSYTYLQEQGEVSSAECFSDIPQYVLSRLNLIAEKSCYNDNEMESCRSSLSGTMSEPLTEPIGEELLMSYAEGSHVRTSVSVTQQETVLTEKDRACGLKWHESFAKYDQNSCLWKTRQLSLFGGLANYSETWPEWGLMHNGECLALKTPAAVMQGDGSGVLPTPLATDWKGGTDKPQKRNGELRTHQFRHWCKIHFGLTYPIPEHSETVMGWPVGWTDLKPLEMDKFQQWLDSHGKYSGVNHAHHRH